MSVFSFICNFLVYGFFVGVFFVLFDLLLKLEAGLGCVVDAVTKPFYRLFDRITPAWGGNLLMVGITLYSAGYVIHAFVTAADILDPLLTVVTGTTIGSVIYLFATEFNISGYTSYAAPIAVAFGSFLAYVYMKFTIVRLESFQMNRVLRWILLVLMNVIFIAFSGFISENMTGVFAETAQWVNNRVMQLYNQVSDFQMQSPGDLLPLIKSFLTMLPIVIGSIIVLLMTLREYFAGALYGFASLLILILVGVAASWLFSYVLHLPLVTDILVILSLFVIDYIRADETANKKFRGFIENLSKKAIRIFFGFFLG